MVALGQGKAAPAIAGKETARIRKQQVQATGIRRIVRSSSFGRITGGFPVSFAGKTGAGQSVILLPFFPKANTLYVRKSRSSVAIAKFLRLH